MAKILKKKNGGFLEGIRYTSMNTVFPFETPVFFLIFVIFGGELFEGAFRRGLFKRFLTILTNVSITDTKIMFIHA